MNTRHNGIQQRQRANEQSPAPTPIAGIRNHKVANAGGDNPADSPEGFQQHRHTTALFGRREFRNQSGSHWQFGAQTKTDDQTSDQKRGQRP